MTRQQAEQVHIGTIVEYEGKRYRVSGIKVRGIAAPFFNLTSLDGGEGVAMVSHELCALA